jgi:hypothetical protein
MNIFISWSGEKSRRVASELKKLIQQIDESNIAWFSGRDMLAGGQWRNELMSRLRDSHFGILCITKESLEKSSWLLFEAGALGAGILESKVCPYLIDVDPKDLSEPLALFQAKNSSKEQTKEMIQALNFAKKQDALPEATINDRFENLWHNFDHLLQEINREFVPLPLELRNQLLDTLSEAFDLDEIRDISYSVGISSRFINWNQALYYVIEDIIRVAVDEHKLGVLIGLAYNKRVRREDVSNLKQKVDQWEELLSKRSK